MDTQIKKGLLEACVLTALRKEDSYGYQIIRDVSPCIAISESTLYPILKRLEGSGCLTTYSVEHQGGCASITGSHSKERIRLRRFCKNGKKSCGCTILLRRGRYE